MSAINNVLRALVSWWLLFIYNILVPDRKPLNSHFQPEYRCRLFWCHTISNPVSMPQPERPVRDKMQKGFEASCLPK